MIIQSLHNLLATILGNIFDDTAHLRKIMAKVHKRWHHEEDPAGSSHFWCCERIVQLPLLPDEIQRGFIPFFFAV
jgi:hypothetical protein